MSIKKNINDLLSVFGIGLHRVKKNVEVNGTPQTKKAKWNDFEIKSPLEHNTSKRMNDFFSDEAMLEQYLSEKRINFYKEIVKLTMSQGIELNNKTVIDVGCGTGHLLSIFLETFNFNSITGIDFSESAINVANETLPEGDFFVHDLYKSLDKKFDIIICTEVLEHLIDPEKAFGRVL